MHPFQDGVAIASRHFKIQNHDVGPGMTVAVGVLADAAEIVDGDTAVFRPTDDAHGRMTL